MREIEGSGSRVDSIEALVRAPYFVPQVQLGLAMMLFFCTHLAEDSSRVVATDRRRDVVQYLLGLLITHLCKLNLRE